VSLKEFRPKLLQKHHLDVQMSQHLQRLFH